MTKQEYSHWVDKAMAVKRLDTARTTNLPVMDLADAMVATWGDKIAKDAQVGQWEDTPAPPTVPPPHLRRDERISIYWSDMDQWFTATYRTSRVEAADGGGKQRSSCVLYDAAGPWANCSKSQLTYWHCLDDEIWQYV